MDQRERRRRERERARRKKIRIVTALLVVILAAICVTAGILIKNNLSSEKDSSSTATEASSETSLTEEPTPEATEEPTPEPTEEPTAEPTPEVTEEPTPEPTEEPTTEGNGHIVCIDAGHEHVDMLDTEPNAPGSDVMKQKVSSGTYGEASGLEEYELNLMVALKLQAILEERGYQVVMTRTDHEVQLSNIDRAEIANDSGAEIMVRIHANSVDDTSVYGMLCYGPAKDNPWLSQDVIVKSLRLSELVVEDFCAATGAKNDGVLESNEMTGINWSTIPVTYVEMGFMSNTEEDLRMAEDSYQDLMAEGIANGVDDYFAEY